jgi:hypothetical protein
MDADRLQTDAQLTSDVTALSIEAARRHYLATLASRGDLAHVLFPASGHIPDEKTQSGVRMKLFETILSIEKALAGDDAQHIVHSRLWEPLVQTGVLRNADIIEFAWARHVEADLEDVLAGSAAELVQLPANLLAHEDAVIADLARRLLVANHTRRHSGALLWQQMPAELLFWLFEKLSQLDDDLCVARSDQLAVLRASFDESQSTSALARKLLFCMDDAVAAGLRVPARSGLPLFLAAIEQSSGIGYDRLLMLMSSSPSPAFFVALRSAGFSSSEANLACQQLFPRTNESGPDIAATFDAIGISEARDFVATWSAKAEDQP